jgi:choline dehydrogenase-like flavoprotein
LTDVDNITAYLKANVIEIITNKAGTKVERVTVKTFSGNTFEVLPKILILACGGIENARLLLLNGIGNQCDQVGRYYMDHPLGITGEIQLNKAGKLSFDSGYFGNKKTSFGATRIGIRLSDTIQEREGVLNSYVSFQPVYNFDQNSKGINAIKAIVKNPKKLLSIAAYSMLLTILRDIPNLYAFVLYKFFNKYQLKTIKIKNYMEQCPVETNRVYLSENKDALGCRKARINWSISEIEMYTMKVLHQVLKEEINKLGVGQLKSPILEGNYTEWPINHDAYHHIGTTRMGNNKRNSVVDKNCQVHDVTNLYIAGSSIFPTGGYANPTYTIVALAIRLADHIKQKLAEGIE